MAWTVEHGREVLDLYWRDGAAPCPACAADVHFDYFPLVVDYVLVATCPHGCGDLWASLAADPERATFRPWFADEAAAVVRDHLAGKAARCPVDGALVEVLESSDWRGGQIVTARCRRCRKGFQTSAAKEDWLALAMSGQAGAGGLASAIPS